MDRSSCLMSWRCSRKVASSNEAPEQGVVGVNGDASQDQRHGGAGSVTRSLVLDCRSHCPLVARPASWTKEERPHGIVSKATGRSVPRKTGLEAGALAHLGDGRRCGSSRALAWGPENHHTFSTEVSHPLSNCF